MAPNQIVGTGENAGKMYFLDKSTNKYSEVLLGEEKDGKASAVPTGKQYTLEDIEKKQSIVPAPKKVEIKDDTSAAAEAKKVADLIKGVTNSLASLPDRETLDRLVESARNQLVVGEIALPALMESLESITTNLDLSKISSIENALGATAVTTQKSQLEIEKYTIAEKGNNEIILALESQLKALSPESEDYSTKSAEITKQIAQTRADFTAKYPVPPHPETETRYLIDSKISGITDTINAMVASVNKVAGVKLQNNSKIERRVRRVENTIVSSYDSMVRMLSSMSGYLNGTDIESIMGWKDSGVSEYVMVTKQSDGVDYQEVLTKKEYDSSTGKFEDVEIKNPQWFKPHFAAEDGIFKIGEFISKMVSPIQKVSSIDLSSVPGPRKLRRDIRRLSQSLTDMVRETVKEFSKIDTTGSKEALELLVGSQGEERVLETIKNAEIGNGKTQSESTERVLSGKKASVVDVMVAFLDTCSKITSFEFKDFFKKTTKFRAMSPLIGRQMTGVVESMVSVIPTKTDSNYKSYEESIQSMNSFIDFFNENAFSEISNIKVPEKKLRTVKGNLRVAIRQVTGILRGLDSIVETLSKAGMEPVKDENSEENDTTSTDKIDIKTATGNFSNYIDGISDILDDVASLKIKEIPSTKSLKKAGDSIEEVLVLVGRVSEMVVDQNNLQPMKTVLSIRSSAEIVTAVAPAMQALAELTLWSRLIRQKDIDGAEALISRYLYIVQMISWRASSLNDTSGMTAIADQISCTIDKIVYMQMLSKLAGDTSWMSDILGTDGAVARFALGMIGVSEALASSDVDIDRAKRQAEALRGISKDIEALMLTARLVGLITRGTKVDETTIEKSKNLVRLLIAPIEELGKQETYDDLKVAEKSVALLALSVLVVAATAFVVIELLANRTKEVGTGMASMAMVSFGSVGIFQKIVQNMDIIKQGAKTMVWIAASFLLFSATILLLGLSNGPTAQALLGFATIVAASLLVLYIVSRISENGRVDRDGIPEVCKPLLAIAGSFLLFSLSILLLGLTNELTMESMLGFALIVGLALGVLWLVSKTDRASIRGALTLMIVGAAFLVFSAVLKILASISDSVDFLSMLGLVGVIAALVGVTALAGLSIVPLLLGSAGIIVLSAAMLVFSVALTVMLGAAKLIGEDAKETIAPVIDTVGYVASRLSKLPIGDVLLATANSVLLLAMMATLTGVVVMVQALKAVAPKPEEAQQVSLAMGGVVAAIKAVTDGLGKIDILTVTKAILVAWEALIMLVPLSLVALILLGFSRFRIATEFDSYNKPIKWENLDGKSLDRVGEMMTGLVGALSAVTTEMSKISLIDITKGLLVSVTALGMLAPLSVIALILLGFSRMRIATEFDENNKPKSWESLDGSSFDRVGDTMVGMVSALNRTVEELNKIGLVSMTKAAVKSVEALAMMAAVSGIMGILVKIGSKRIPVEWDSSNKPTRYENFDDAMVSKSVETSMLLVSSIDRMAQTIGNYDTKNLKKAEKNAKTMKGIVKPVNAMLDLIVKMTSGPLNYGPVDSEGNPLGDGQSVKGNIGDYLKSHEKQVTSNIDTLIGIFNSIAEKVSSKDGIGNVSSKTLKKAKENMKTVGGITGTLMPLIDMVQMLTSGEMNIGTEDHPEKVNLGDFVTLKKPEIEKNLDSLFGLVTWIGQKADTFNAGSSNRDLRRANKKMGKVAEVIDALNPAIDLIMKLSEGEFPLESEDGTVKKLNLGDYVAAQRTTVEGNIDTLIDFITHLASRAAELGKDSTIGKRDIKRAGSKAGLIGGVLDSMMGTMEIIEKMASGQIQTGTNEDGTPVMESLSKFLETSGGKISANLDLLMDFIVGPNGIQSHLDKITGEKSKATDKKKNSIEVVQSFTDTVNSILDLTKKMGDQMDDSKTKDLFGTDPKKSLGGRLGRLMEGYSVPLEDTSIFAKQSNFKVRFKNLTDYDVLMKKIMNVKEVSNYEKSVKATGSMVDSINSINDTKIDKLNQLMRNMIQFGETMDDALKDVLDQVVELAEELHYVIEANERKTNPDEYRSQKQQERQSANPLSPKNQQQPAAQPASAPVPKQPSVDITTLEDRVGDLVRLVEYIKGRM